MGFSFDIYNKLKQPKMFLANPQKNYVGSISGAENVKLTLKFNNLWELEFVIYEKSNDEYTEYYDKIVEKRLVELQGICWFQIQDISEAHDDTTLESYKTVKCLSLENELIGKKIHNIEGVYALYDNSDVEYSLLHIISAESGYSIGHVDNELLDKYRTFSTDSEQIYNFLTTTASKSFDCLFVFDTYTRSISAYKLANIGTLTDIVISRKNILKEYIKECSADKIITKLKVVGADGVDIRAVCPTGTNYLINLDYFLSIDWMSQSTIDAWNSYKTKYNNNLTTYNSTLSLLKTKQSELLTLETELTDLQSNKTAQENIIGVSVELHGRVPIATDSDYTNYQNAITLLNDYTSQIVTKKSAIDSKNSEIYSTQVILDNIGINLNWSTNFTLEQIAEINTFISENEEYQDSTFVQSDIMSDSEVIDMKLELMQYGSNELTRASQPQYVYQTTINNILTICDDKDELIQYSTWIQNFWVGNLITIKFRDDYYTTARLMEMVIDFDNLSDISVKFSDKSRLDDEFIQLAEIISNSGRASSTLSLKQLGYDEASKLVNPVREFINGTLSATLNAFQSNDNQEMLYDKFGLHGRKWLPEQSKYADNQLWINNNGILLTSDNWHSSATALGLLTCPDGSTKYGLATDVIFGNFVLTSALTISNQSNTITMNDSGAIFKNCDVQITKGTNNLYLNATDGIKLTNNGVSQFFINASGDAEFKGQITGGSMNINNVFSVDGFGYLTSTSGSIGGWNISPNGLTSYNTTTSIELYNSGNHAMKLSYNGLHLFNHYSGDSQYLSSMVATYNSTTGENGAVMVQGGQAEYFAIGYTDATSPYSGMAVYPDMVYTRNGYSSYPSPGFHFAKPIYAYGGLKDNAGNNYLTLQNFSTDDITADDSIDGYIQFNGVRAAGYNYVTNNFALSNHTQSSTSIIASLTPSENIMFSNKNAASSTWCLATFQQISSSDFRLKRNIFDMDSRFEQLFYTLKPKFYQFKPLNDGSLDSPENDERVHCGLMAHEVENAKTNVGIIDNLALVKTRPVRAYTLEGTYINDEVHLVNYEELISINVYATQKLNEKITALEARITTLENK